MQASRSHQDRQTSGVRGRLRGLLGQGTLWLHLRICLECGHVGCCDNSPARHTTAHANASGHPVIRSLEPGEEWSWCYIDRTAMLTPGVEGPTINPSVTSRRIRPTLPALGAEPPHFGPNVSDPFAHEAREKSRIGGVRTASVAPLGAVDMTQTCVVKRFGYRGQCMKCATGCDARPEERNLIVMVMGSTHFVAPRVATSAASWATAGDPP